MRTIKFRVWDGHRMTTNVHRLNWQIPKHFAQVILRSVEIYTDRGESDGEVRFGVVYPENILMQFTGLLDADGKEIYEGDVLEWYDGESDEDPVIAQGIVFYADGCYRCSIDGEFFPSWRMEGNWPMRVLGNRYEHPHLLEKVETAHDET